VVTSQQEFMVEKRQHVTWQHQINAKTKKSIQRLEAQIGKMARELSETKKDEFLTQTILIQGVISNESYNNSKKWQDHRN
jgi:hypothetical protein